MRARMFVSWAVVSGGIVLAISCSAAWSQSNPVPDASQFAGCPPVLPAEEGERSIVVPTIAPHVEPPRQEVPHIASLPQSPDHEASKSLLKEKLAQRDQLQREIAALRESTKTPEQISVHLKMVEINRTKLRKLGIDWSTLANGKLRQADVAAMFGVESRSVNSVPSTMAMCPNVDPAVLSAIADLERLNVSRVLTSPSIVVMSGQPGALHVGREIPIASPAAPGGVRTQRVGTQIDLTADSLGDNRVRIQVRPRVSEPVGISGVNQNGEMVPALRAQLDTAFETEFGKATILSGLVQERTEATIDQFGRPGEEKQEIALMLIVTPEIVR